MSEYEKHRRTKAVGERWETAGKIERIKRMGSDRDTSRLQEREGKT